MKPVIIVYAKVPAPGHAKTRLIPRLGEAGAARLHGAFVEDTLAMVTTLAESFDIELHTDVPTNAWSWTGVPGFSARAISEQSCTRHYARPWMEVVH